MDFFYLSEEEIFQKLSFALAKKLNFDNSTIEIISKEIFDLICLSHSVEKIDF